MKSNRSDAGDKKTHLANLKIWAPIALITAALAFWSLIIEPGMLVRREISLTGWPGEPLKIIFISDLHAGAPHIDRDYVDELVRKIQSEKPDLLLLGGDLVINEVVGGKEIPFPEVAAKFKAVNPRLGKFAVLGNHDWWNDEPLIREQLKLNGFEVLENESRKIAGFTLVGIGDDYTKHADLLKAFTGAQPPVIAFMHDPGALTANQNGFFLALAGHMHGGQINLPMYGAIITPGRAPREWADGWTELPQGKLFVSKGIGTSSLPVRFHAAPEYVTVTLAR